MPTKIITYCRQKAKVVCDGNCYKAWGINNRPEEQLSDDEDDIMWYADDELPVAPIDPGTTEGGEPKPESSEEFPNKWCVRECERSTLCKPGKWREPLEPEDWNKRRYNQPWKHQESNNENRRVRSQNRRLT